MRTMVTKAAAIPADTTTSGWADTLNQTVIGDFIESLMPFSIYPALRAWGDKADADKLNHDHGYVKQFLYELDGADKASSAFLTQVADFRAALEAHIREEEDAILPPLHKALGKAGNAKVTAQANKEGFKLA